MNLTWFYFHCVLALVIIVKDYNGTLEEDLNKFEERLGIRTELPSDSIENVPPPIRKVPHPMDSVPSPGPSPPSPGSKPAVLDPPAKSTIPSPAQMHFSPAGAAPAPQ